MSYIKNILLSTELKRGNAAEIAYTTELAKLLGAKLYLLHTYHVPIPATEIDFIDITAIEEGLILDAKEKFNQIKKDFFYSDTVKYEFLLKVGGVENNIENVIAEKSIDLLVMGTSGPHGLLELGGSHTTNIITTTRIPVFVIPEKASFESFKNILYACDLKKLSTHLDLLEAIVKRSHACLHILTIENKFRQLTIREKITEITINHIFSGVEVEHHYEAGENIEKKILEYSENHNIHLLAITPHHHSLWEKIMQKSITKKLLFHSDIPLLILPE